MNHLEPRPRQRNSLAEASGPTLLNFSAAKRVYKPERHAEPALCGIRKMRAKQPQIDPRSPMRVDQDIAAATQEPTASVVTRAHAPDPCLSDRAAQVRSTSLEFRKGMDRMQYLDLF